MSIYSKMFQVRFLGHFHPLFISWMITDKCNLKCCACNRNQGSLGDSPKEITGRVIELTAVEKVFKVNLTGGEPLLHPEIDNIVKQLRKNDIKVTMNTNGFYVIDKIDLLKTMNGVNVSLDGNRELHDSYRGNGSYDAAVKAIEWLRGNGVPVKITCSIGYGMGMKDMESVLEIARDFGVPAVFQPSQLFILGGREPNTTAPDPENFRNCLKYVSTFKHNHTGAILNSFQGLKHLSKWPADAKISCGAGKFFCRIDPAGDTFACSNCLGPERPIGNILTFSLADLFTGYQHPPCSQCWCADRVEANLILGLNPGAITNYLLHRKNFNL